MIPKTIHYCWFGGNPLPELALRCIASWKKFCPDCEIIEWNESNFDVNACAYTREAYQAKKWAFVSDYARFQILYEHGGLYFDTDVELLRPLDDLLARGAFMGREYGDRLSIAPGLGLAAEPGMAFYREMLEGYRARHYLLPDGTPDGKTVVDYTTEALERHGLQKDGALLRAAGVTVYPAAYFCPMDYDTGALHITDETRSIHHYCASWHNEAQQYALGVQAEIKREGNGMLTIMTPTYNRAYSLPEAYRSLREQSCFDFEWIVVDDGSQDETEQLVRGWAAQCADFPIRYCRQPNGGKHRAVNRGVQLARGAWFLTLDSDDSLLPCAVERIAAWTAEVAGRDDLAGVAGLKQTQGKPVGGALRAPYVEASNAERWRFGLLGDKADVYRTELMRRYPFPEFEGENFIRESVVWDRIAYEGYRLRWYNEVIYQCDYLADGLTKNTNAETYRKNFRGYTACCRVYVEAHSGIWALHKCGEFHSVAKPKGLRRRDEAKLLGVRGLYYDAGIAVFALKTALKRLRGR